MDILQSMRIFDAMANPDPFLRFICQMINELLRRLVVFSTDTPMEEHEKFGAANAHATPKYWRRSERGTRKESAS